MGKFNILISIAALALLATGCTSAVKPQSTATPAAPSEQAQPAQTSGVTQAQPAQMDELDNPASPLAQRTIYFAFDKSEIEQKYIDLLTAHAQYLIAHPSMHVRLEGNTDERGSREYNIALGDRRAQAVRRFLLFQGVNADQITTVSYGEERPVDPGHNEAAWAKNRRVDIVYLR